MPLWGSTPLLVNATTAAGMPSALPVSAPALGQIMAEAKLLGLRQSLLPQLLKW